MHPSHAELLAEIQRVGRAPARGGHNDSYGGSGHVYYMVSVPVRRGIAKDWLTAHPGVSTVEFLAVVESLFAGESHEEKTLAALLLGYHVAGRRHTGPADVDRWLGHLHGWAEIDTLCQNVYTAGELLGDWPGWAGLIRRLSREPDPHRRRAALVLLTRPVHISTEVRLRDLAVETVDVLRGERDPLITKAVSWLLRSMVTNHWDTVASYLLANEAVLPPIAVRETRTKLRTGTKRGTGGP